MPRHQFRQHVNGLVAMLCEQSMAGIRQVGFGLNATIPPAKIPREFWAGGRGRKLEPNQTLEAMWLQVESPERFGLRGSERALFENDKA